MTGFGSWMNWDQATGGGVVNAYIIPESGSVLTHVNATDLKNSTAKVGGAWTQNGTVPFNSSSVPVPSVGPYSDSNYFSQGVGSPMNVASPGPYTFAIAFSATGADGGVLISTGNFNVSGFYVYENAVFSTSGAGITASITSQIGPTSNKLNVLMFGLDA
jgi:hypothetical protein